MMRAPLRRVILASGQRLTAAAKGGRAKVARREALKAALRVWSTYERPRSGKVEGKISAAVRVVEEAVAPAAVVVTSDDLAVVVNPPCKADRPRQI
jgi:hypothetical protein